MKSKLIKSILLAIICSGACLTSQAQRGEAPLTNTAIVKLVRAGFKEKTVISIIHNRPCRFNLDPDRLIELKRHGVSENIILAMLAHDGRFVAEDDWTNDSDFTRSTSRPGMDQEKQSTGADIFGGSQGSKSQTGGRGMSGGNEGETVTTGSATVRILRPPAEAGGGPIKLERTPTLTNESVIKLVEAGFSEGTIIKRIEDSPADFDLTNPKLEELRRRRVTEAIISAMIAAMNDEADPNLRAPGKTKGN
jgi:hypothetical protein